MPAVRVEGVVKRFGATVALDGAGLEIPAGMVFGLLGPNGAGKTTLVRILATLSGSRPPRRGFSIQPDGSFTVSLRTYTWCTQGPPPWKTSAG